MSDHRKQSCDEVHPTAAVYHPDGHDRSVTGEITLFDRPVLVDGEYRSVKLLLHDDHSISWEQV